MYFYFYNIISNKQISKKVFSEQYIILENNVLSIMFTFYYIISNKQIYKKVFSEQYIIVENNVLSIISDDPSY